ncbi:hypothetical protein P3T39_006712 [Kitasatospora sp. GP82]|nr:hypothetical protein [Kitasatospora sp. GP82]
MTGTSAGRPVRAGRQTAQQPFSHRGRERPDSRWRVVAASGCLTVAAVSVGLFQLFLLPHWLPHLGTVRGWVLAPLVLLTTPFWSLVHEAIHGTLLTERSWNDSCGRVLAVLFGAPFAILEAGHLLLQPHTARAQRGLRRRQDQEGKGGAGVLRAAVGRALPRGGGVGTAGAAAGSRAEAPRAQDRLAGHGGRVAAGAYGAGASARPVPAGRGVGRRRPCGCLRGLRSERLDALCRVGRAGSRGVPVGQRLPLLHHSTHRWRR